MSPSLERLQIGFAAALADTGAAPQLGGAFIDTDGRGLERLALYRGNILAAQEKALAAAFPVIRALVGEDFFAALARSFGRAHPSVSGDLNAFGARFAEFLATFRHAWALPYLGDVAALEWSVHRARYAADARVPPRERIAALSADELLSARFTLHPACASFSSDFPITSIWLAHQPGTQVQLPETLDQPECALVVRPRWDVRVLAASKGEVAALAALRAGANMDRMIAAALRVDTDFDFAKAFVRWLDCNVFADIEHAAFDSSVTGS